MRATATAPANIAFMKYWGNANEQLRIPWHGSVSMNISNATTTTTVEFDENFTNDELQIDGKVANAIETERVSHFLSNVRRLGQRNVFAKVSSQNSFPKGAGIASSSSAFSALALAAVTALGIDMSQKELSALARLGSGSACRSIPDGFVEWIPGRADEHASSYAQQLFAPDYWDLVDLIAIVDPDEKKVGSSVGHSMAASSRLYPSRLQTQAARIDLLKAALAEKDFSNFGNIIEEEALNMHAIMMTSNPILLYWTPASLGIMHAVQNWRKDNLESYFTIDAGPNIHVISQSGSVTVLEAKLRELPGVQNVLTCHPCEGARVLH